MTGLPSKPHQDERSRPVTKRSPPETATRAPSDGTRVAVINAAAGSTVRGMRRTHAAQQVADTLIDISSRVPDHPVARSRWLQAEATRTISSAGPLGKTGARGRVKGHLFEDLDIAAYNKSGAAAGKSMVKRVNARNATYDASKLQLGKGFRGAVQHKSSPAGVELAIKKMEKAKPGSAARGTIRVPGDRAAEAARRAGKRARVQGSTVTSGQLDSTLDSGLVELAASGSKATSARRPLARGSARAALISSAVGAVTDIPSLAAGELTGRDFAENRALDAAEAVVVTTVGALAAGAVVGTTAGTAAAAAAGGAVASAAATGAGAIAGMGSVGAAAATALGGVTAAAAGPAIVGGAVVLGVGLVIGAGFKRVRGHVNARHGARRQLRRSATAAELTVGSVESAALAVELRGRYEFSDNEFVSIRGEVRHLDESTDKASRRQITARLRRRGFYVSDWAPHGQRFGVIDLEALRAGGLIVIVDDSGCTP